MTYTLPLSEVKVRLSRLVSDIFNKEDEIIITKNGKPAAVLMNAEEFEGWKETLEIMSDPKLMARIRRNQEALAKGKGKVYSSTKEFFESL